MVLVKERVQRLSEVAGNYLIGVVSPNPVSTYGDYEVGGGTIDLGATEMYSVEKMKLEP
jgi:hypothetical protein